MKQSMLRVAMTAVSVLLAASLSLAADAKKPDIKAAPKAAVEKTATDAKTTAKGTADTAKAAAKKELVDINSATDAELKAVPGIGDAYAAKIVVGRPYANKTQLKSRNILPGPVYEKVKDLIIAKQPKKEAAPAKKK